MARVVTNQDKGKIAQVLGPVVDVEFEGFDLPKIYTALKTTNKAIGNQENNLVLEVAQHLGEGRVRCIAMDATDGLVRGQEVLNTRNPIQVPVGEEVLGRIINVTGDPVDEMGPVPAKKHYPIHRAPPSFKDQSVTVE